MCGMMPFVGFFCMSHTQTYPSKEPESTSSSSLPSKHAVIKHVTVLECSLRLVVLPVSRFQSLSDPSS